MWRRGAAAAMLSADRADLWLPGGLVALAFAGWLPFVLVVFQLPGAGDWPFIAAAVADSPIFPWNLIGLAGLALGIVALGLVLAAAGETALLARINPGAVEPTARAVARAAVVLAVASLPALAAAALLGLSVVEAAIREFQSPDVGGGPILRTLLEVAPLSGVLGAAVFVGQLIGSPILRRAVSGPLRSALRAGVRDLAARPRLAVVGVVTMLVHLLWLASVYALLTVLWRPVAAGLAGGLRADPAVAALLLGFVAIWIGLVLGSGAVHAWASVWWTSELSPGAAWPGQEVNRYPIPN